jgi:hypothetical protein
MMYILFYLPLIIIIIVLGIHLQGPVLRHDPPSSAFLGADNRLCHNAQLICWVGGFANFLSGLPPKCDSSKLCLLNS